MPLSTGGRNVLRSIAVGGALVGSLAMASSASAALGGAASAHFNNRPNLESVTFNGQVAAFHFDKPVQPAFLAPPSLDPGDFTIGGYRSQSVEPAIVPADTANIAVSDPKTVLVTYAGHAPDFNEATFGAVRGGIVQGYGTFATPNLADATKLTGSDSESGTRGHTAAPDLQSVAVDLDNNEIDYVFDQNVEGDAIADPDPNNFLFIDSDGDHHHGNDIVDVDGNVVTVKFPFGPGNRVDEARQAIVLNDNEGESSAPAIRSTDTPSSLAPTANVNIPGKPSINENPTLVSATLEPNSATIVYTFDQNMASADPDDFFAVFSTGVRADAASTTIIGNTVRATFVPADISAEHLVFASVSEDSGNTTATSGQVVRYGGKPIGGNAGAKASGYTTAPDALSATFNRTSGQVTVLFDSRIVPAGFFGPDPDDFILLSESGDAIPSTTSVTGVAESINGPSQSRVILQYDPARVNSAFPTGFPGGALRIRGRRNAGGSAFFAPNGPAVVGSVVPVLTGDASNIETIIVPTETTSNFSK